MARWIVPVAGALDRPGRRPGIARADFHILAADRAEAEDTACRLIEGDRYSWLWIDSKTLLPLTQAEIKEVVDIRAFLTDIAPLEPDREALLNPRAVREEADESALLASYGPEVVGAVRDAAARLHDADLDPYRAAELFIAIYNTTSHA